VVAGFPACPRRGEARDILILIERERRVCDDEIATTRHARRGTIVQFGVVALLVVLFFALGVVIKSGWTLAFDERAHRFVRDLGSMAFEEDDTSLRTRFMHLGPDIGTATILFVPLTAFVLVRQCRRRAALLLLLSTGGSVVMALCLKGIFQRTRPDQLCSHGPFCVINYLYPSNHTILSLVSYGLIGALIAGRRAGMRRTLVNLFVIVIVGFVAVSLIYLNTHYLTDVIGGLLIGSAWFIVSLHLLRHMEA